MLILHGVRIFLGSGERRWAKQAIRIQGSLGAAECIESQLKPPQALLKRLQYTSRRTGAQGLCSVLA